MPLIRCRGFRGLPGFVAFFQTLGGILIPAPVLSLPNRAGRLVFLDVSVRDVTASFPGDHARTDRRAWSALLRE